MFDICADPLLLVSAAFQNGHWNILFRCTFGPAKIVEWDRLWAALPLTLPGFPNTVSWSRSPSGKFSVSSAYHALCCSPTILWTSPLWKAPLPLKIKLFVWQQLRDRLPSGTEVLNRTGRVMAYAPFVWFRRLGQTFCSRARLYVPSGVSYMRPWALLGGPRLCGVSSDQGYPDRAESSPILAYFCSDVMDVMDDT